MPLNLEPLELHSGLAVGRRQRPLPEAVRGGGRPVRSPRAVLESRLLDALRQPPCHVLFSGGKDSSVVLAAALDVARRHGLDPPIALTARYAAHPETDEADWQESVIAHLGVRDWTVFHVDWELDLVGAIATDAMRGQGPFWPGNAHAMVLFARQARSGTLLTGSGGDELFDPWSGRRPPIRQMARLRPLHRAVKWSAYSALPTPVRLRVGRERLRTVLPWLTADAQGELDARMQTGLPLLPSWRRSARKLIGSRYYELVRSQLDRFASDAGVRLVEPMMDPEFVMAAAAAGPRHGYEGRPQAFTTMFSDLLPREILTRSSKAVFTEVNWGPETRAFVAGWDGAGVDTRLVDVEALRAVWSRTSPDGRTLGCLQLAWLAAQGRPGSGSQPGGGRGAGVP